MTTPANNPGTTDAGKGEEQTSTLDQLHETLSFVEARADQLHTQADELRGQADEQEHQLLAKLEQTDDPAERQQLQSELDEVWRTQRLLQEPDALPSDEHQDVDRQPDQRDGDGDDRGSGRPTDPGAPDHSELQRRPDSRVEGPDQER